MHYIYLRCCGSLTLNRINTEHSDRSKLNQCCQLWGSGGIVLVQHTFPMNKMTPAAMGVSHSKQFETIGSRSVSVSPTCLWSFSVSCVAQTCELYIWQLNEGTPYENSHRDWSNIKRGRKTQAHNTKLRVTNIFSSDLNKPREQPLDGWAKNKTKVWFPARGRGYLMCPQFYDKTKHLQRTVND